VIEALAPIAAGTASGVALAAALGGFRGRRNKDLVETLERLVEAKALENIDLEKRLARLEAKVDILESTFAERIADRVEARLETYLNLMGGPR
jgi:hypothetical protein